MNIAEHGPGERMRRVAQRHSDTYKGMREGCQHCSVCSHEACTSCKGVRILAHSYLPLGKKRLKQTMYTYDY